LPFWADATSNPKEQQGCIDEGGDHLSFAVRVFRSQDIQDVGDEEDRGENERKDSQRFYILWLRKEKWETVEYDDDEGSCG
jgi:hypothetical protein